MRQLGALGSHPVWATCIKESVTVAVVGLWLVSRGRRMSDFVPPWHLLAALVAMGLATQLAGNLPVQWALGVVGIGLTIAAIYGVMLTAGAVLGMLFLGERVSGRAVASIAALVGAIGLLTVGATSGARTVPGIADLGMLALGIAAPCLAGCVYALLTITIRTTVSRAVPVTTVVFVITGMGTLSLGALSLACLGPQKLLDTPPAHLGLMFLAGTFNLLAFLAITKGLQTATVVHANVLNASQVAMSSMVGVLLFNEMCNGWLAAGVCLTIAGLIMVGSPQSDEQEVPGV